MKMFKKKKQAEKNVERIILLLEELNEQIRSVMTPPVGGVQNAIFIRDSKR